MEVSTVSDRRKTSRLMLSRLSTRAQTNELARARLHVPASYLTSWKAMLRKGEGIQLVNELGSPGAKVLVDGR